MTKVINIADLKKPSPVVLVIDGVRHEMKQPSIEDFIFNMELVEKLGIKASPVDELRAMVQIVKRGFPTLTEAEILAWPMDYVQQISEIVRGSGGEIVTTDESKIEEANASGNDQPAT